MENLYRDRRPHSGARYHYSVAQRTQEIGIRMALGAQVGGVVGMVIREALRPALSGLALGLVGALWLTRLLASLLYGVRPADPLTLALVSITLMLVAILASLVPAWTASRIDPLVALRAESL